MHVSNCEHHSLAYYIKYDIGNMKEMDTAQMFRRNVIQGESEKFENRGFIGTAIDRAEPHRRMIFEYRFTESGFWRLDFVQVALFGSIVKALIMRACYFISLIDEQSNWVKCFYWAKSYIQRRAATSRSEWWLNVEQNNSSKLCWETGIMDTYIPFGRVFPSS